MEKQYRSMLKFCKWINMKRFSTAGVLALFYKDSSLGQLSRNGRTFQVGKL